MGRWINLWWHYPFTTAVRYLEKTGMEVTGVVLRIGPLAFCICWGKQRFPVVKPSQEPADGNSEIFV